MIILRDDVESVFNVLVRCPLSTVSADQFAVTEKTIRLQARRSGRTPRLVRLRTEPFILTAIRPQRNGYRDGFSPSHRRYRLTDVESLVDDADRLGPVLAEDDFRFRTIRHGDRIAIERVF